MDDDYVTRSILLLCVDPCDDQSCENSFFVFFVDMIRKPNENLAIRSRINQVTSHRINIRALRVKVMIWRNILHLSNEFKRHR